MRLKRLFDLAVSGSALLLLAGPMVGIALAVWASSGRPVLYRSRRLGQGGVTFEMVKFRTMRTASPDLRNPDGSTYTRADDPRVTRVGRWLRRTSLDELPQLWNVLRGDMSLVGPRPDLPDQIQYYAPADHRRLEVPPGLTGLSQVSGRNDLDWAQRRALDLEYVDSRSFTTDLLIIARTVPRVVLGRGVVGRPDSERS